MSNQELVSIIREFQEYKRIKEEADAALKALQGRITAHMEQQGAAEAAAGSGAAVGVYKVSYKPVTSIRLNTNALKAAKPDIFAQFSTTSTTKCFTVA